MNAKPDKSNLVIRLLIAILGIALAIIGWYRFVD